ncbi:MAG TPA: type 4a pilus biogenesis protein PilO [Candidatus Saccharimonadales bacterium]|nr:type 4a pilus biogenesis protein PilO [Candidatus Saccharimonadales bacterium]
MNRLPPWGFTGVMAALCLALLYIGYSQIPGFSDMQSRIESDQAKLADLKAQINRGRDAARRRADLEKEIQQKDAELAGLRRILPTEPEMGDLIKWLESQASRFNLAIKSVSEATIKQEEFFKEYTYAMTIEGNYHDLGRFFDVIGKHDRIINIKNVKIDKNTGKDARTRSIRTAFSALTFVYTAKSEG